MKCEQLLACLSDYLDGDMDTIRCSELEAHARNCPRCRETLASLRACVEAARGLGRATVPDDVCKRVMAELKRHCPGDR